LLSNKFTIRSASALASLIPTGTAIPIVKGPLAGYKWIAGAAAGSAKGLSVIWNLAEAGQLSKAAGLVNHDSICFDIGANVGLYTLLFARHSRHVYAFEPVPRNIRYLSQTLETNKIRNATIIPAAVSAQTGMGSFSEGMNPASGHVDASGRQPITMLSLDDFTASYSIVPSIIKIDVEGGEEDVLKGGLHLLRKHRPSILLSTHGDEMRVACMDILSGIYREIIPLNASTPSSASEFAVVA
jgi:FkbM family methyltransferase